MARYAILSFLAGALGASAGDNSIDLGWLPVVLTIVFGSSGVGALFLLRAQRMKLNEESSDLAMLKLQRAMDAQERVWKQQLEFADRRILRLEADLATAETDRQRKQVELERVKEERDRIERELRSTQERLLLVKETLAARTREDDPTI